MADCSSSPGSHSQSSPFFAFRWLIGPLALTSFSIGPCWVFLIHAILSNLGLTTWAEELYVRSWQYLLFACCYLLVVQVIVLSLLLAWSAGRLWGRLLVYWSLVVGLGACVVTGIWFSTHLNYWLQGRQSPGSPFNHDTEFSSTTDWSRVAAIPLLLLAVQFPFWMSRALLGWRLQRVQVADDAGPAVVQRESLSIADLLTGTAVVAVCLGLLRLGLLVDLAVTEMSNRKVLVELSISAVVIALALYATAVPLAALFLRDFRRNVAWAAALLMVVVCTLVVDFAIGSGPTSLDRWQGLFDCAFGALILILAYCGGLTVLYRCGWRLVWRKPGFTGKSTV